MGLVIALVQIVVFFTALMLLFLKTGFISYCYFFPLGSIFSLSLYHGFMPSFVKFKFPGISINLINVVKIPSTYYLI